ncbi:MULTISPECIES: hypothetical protein [Cyclobacteriaceae]|uniref:Uncharacterized protein n=2 Tax=Cyclobacteriaceae TaxID=563798 RepID=A0ABV9T0R8_9BACT
MKKPKYGMPTPSTRKEFEQNISLLYEDMLRVFDSKDDDLIQNKVWSTGQHLKKVKLLPNGRLHLNTIDERIRLQSNMMDWFKRIPPLSQKDE